MSIESFKKVELALGLDSGQSYSEAEHLIQADKADVNFFESELNLTPDPLTKDIVKGADSLSNSLAEKKHEFEIALKKASDTADPSDVLAAARSLSDYSIQTSIVAKAAGKSSQAVDKITNLN